MDIMQNIRNFVGKPASNRMLYQMNGSNKITISSVNATNSKHPNQQQQKTSQAKEQWFVYTSVKTMHFVYVCIFEYLK